VVGAKDGASALPDLEEDAALAAFAAPVSVNPTGPVNLKFLGSRFLFCFFLPFARRLCKSSLRVRLSVAELENESNFFSSLYFCEYVPTSDDAAAS